MVTTLVEGKVVYKASERHEAVIILPGYQLIDNGYEELAPQEVDVEMYVGWKDGRIYFRGRYFGRNHASIIQVV